MWLRDICCLYVGRAWKFLWMIILRKCTFFMGSLFFYEEILHSLSSFPTIHDCVIDLKNVCTYWVVTWLSFLTKCVVKKQCILTLKSSWTHQLQIYLYQRIFKNSFCLLILGQRFLWHEIAMKVKLASYNNDNLLLAHLPVCQEINKHKIHSWQTQFIGSQRSGC